jgi:hypothetical protein
MLQTINKIWISILLSLSVFIFSNVKADVTIVMVRHAEKQSGDLGQLTCQGLNRALKLAPLLTSRFGKANEVFAPNPAVKIKHGSHEWFYVRPLATIEPYAIRLNLPVNTGYGWNDINPVIDSVLARQEGLVVIAWEHYQLEMMSKEIVNRLGSSQTIPTWHQDEFDKIYIIKIATSPNSKPSFISFEDQKQGLNGQALSCPE